MKSNARVESGEGVNVVIGANGAATIAGIRLALQADDIHVCAEARTVQELVNAVEQFAPDVCLVDVELEGGAGIRGAAEVGARNTRVPVVLLAEEADEEEFLDAMRAGAAGYIPHSIAPERLPKLVRAVMKGEPAIPRSFVMPLIAELRQRPSRRHLAVRNGRGADLTSREWEVLDFVRGELSTREIAARLLISEVTVRRHISAVLKKLEVRTRDEAVKLLQSA